MTPGPLGDFVDTLGTLQIDSIHAGDCLDLMEKLPEDSIDLLVTDPPYFLPANSYVGTRSKGARRTIADTSIIATYFDLVMSEVDRVLKPNGTAYAFCDGQSYPIIYLSMFPFFKYVRPIIWDKVVSYNGYTWRHQHELIAWGEREDAERIPTGDGDVLRFRGVMQDDRLHGAEKPVSVLMKLISKHGTGKVILDLYCGSGSVPEAAISTGNRFIAFELDKAHAETARNRVLNLQLSAVGVTQQRRAADQLRGENSGVRLPGM